MQKETFSFIILAAGKGTRMKSAKPKVLHEVAGKPIISHIIDKILSIRNNIFIDKVVIVLGKESKEIKLFIENNYKDINIVIQKNQLGTADAVLAAKNTFKNFKGKLIVLCGDTPLITSKLLLGLRELGKKLETRLNSKIKETVRQAGIGEDQVTKSEMNRVSSLVVKEVTISGYEIADTKLVQLDNGNYRSFILLEYPIAQVYKAFINKVENNENLKTNITALKNTEAFKELEEYVSEFSGA